MALTENQVKKISLAYQANEGNAEGIAYWVNSGVNDATAASIFYAANTSLQSLSGLALATKIFENLGLNAETHPGFNQEGLAYWGNLIDSGAVAKDQAGLVIANAVRDNLGLTDDTFTQHIEKIKDITPITPSGETFMLTEGIDYADNANSYHIVDGKSISDTFKFTAGDDVVVATSKTLNSSDKLVDLTTTDNDVLQLNLGIADEGTIKVGNTTGGIGSGAKIVGIEELDIVSAGAEDVTVEKLFSGIKTLKVSGSFVESFTFTGSATDTALTTIDVSGVSVGDVSLDASAIKQDLTITGPNAAATIQGGSGVNTITGQGTITGGDKADVITLNGAATVTGGSGNDTITVDAVGAATINIGAEDTNGIDAIVGFNATKDKIKFISTSAKSTDLSDKTITFVSMEAAKEALATDSNLGDKTNYPSASGQDTGYFGLVFNVGDKTYLAIDSGASTGYKSSEDAIVEITGYTGTIDDLAKAIVTAV